MAAHAPGRRRRHRPHRRLHRPGPAPGRLARHRHDADEPAARRWPSSWAPSTPSATTPTPRSPSSPPRCGPSPAAARRALAAGPGVVTDVGSVKASVVDAVDDPRFVGGHPMAGSEQEGVDGADPDLFAGAVWVLTPTAATDDATYAAAAARSSPSSAPRWWPSPPSATTPWWPWCPTCPTSPPPRSWAWPTSGPRSTPPCCAWPPAASGT